MSTKRKQIIDAAATLLATATGLTIYRNLDYALTENKLPALAIERGSDMPDEETSPLGIQDHALILKATLLIAGSAHPESDADGYEANIHAALMAVNSLGGIDVACDWVGTAEPDFDLGDCGMFALAYRIRFRTTRNSMEI